MPGVNKVNGLNKLDKDAIDEKVKLIAEYSKNAEEAIKDLAQEVCNSTWLRYIIMDSDL